MKVKVIKKWTLNGSQYNFIGELLEVEREYAVPAIKQGYLEDVNGIVKPDKEIKIQTKKGK